jgi:hypothetical protein
MNMRYVRSGSDGSQYGVAALLAETGLTEVALAEAVNTVVEDVMGTPDRASDRCVRMLLHGSIRWPHRHHRKAL